MRQSYIDFDDAYFKRILRSAGVDSLTREAAERVYARAYAAAPVATGDYQRGLMVRKERAATRDVYLVVGTDWKTLLVESKTGNLARALKGA